MTGLEFLRASATTPEEIADIIAEQCPPAVPTECDRFSCRMCWISWLTTDEPPKEKGPSDKQTAPDEEGLHPNLVEMYAKMFRKTQRTSEATLRAYTACGPSLYPTQVSAPEQCAQPQPPEP